MSLSPPIAVMHWFCLRAKTGKEAQVAAYCRNVLGLETYYPLLRECRTIRRVRQQTVGPLFPRYLFCRLDPGLFFRAVRYAPGVVEIVHFGGVPAIVPEALIAELKLWIGEGVNGGIHPSLLPAGCQVQIRHGPLRGMTAVILRACDDDDRVEVLLSLLKDEVKATVRRDQLDLTQAG